MEAIILAGGKGTRLQSVVSVVPKPMADIAGRPFLCYQIDHLIKHGVSRLILSVGYKSESIIEYFQNSYKGIPIIYAIENQPLGTGGAIRLALSKCETDNILVINGDTFIDIDFNKIQYLHHHFSSAFTIATIQINSSGRYGGLSINNKCILEGFVPRKEKGQYFINAGIYMINKRSFIEETIGEPFSLETDFLAVKIDTHKIHVVPYSNKYFIDIGIPEDYYQAIIDLPMRHLFNFKEKFLFLDRDGIINKKIDSDYERSLECFQFKVGVLEAVCILSQTFRRICVLTNQRGVRQGLMIHSDVTLIHEEMKKKIMERGGKIDGVFSRSHINEEGCGGRKPRTELFYKAQHEFMEIQFDASFMVSDSATDIEGAYNLGIKAVYIHYSKEKYFNFDLLLKIDLVFKNLLEYANYCKQKGEIF